MPLPKLLIICTVTPVMQADLEAHFDLIFDADLTDPYGWLDTHGGDVRHVLTDGHLGITQDLLARLPNVQAISCYGVGYDNIDTDATCGQGIQVSHTPGVLNDEVATTAVLLMMSCYRNFLAETRNAASGAWETGNLPLARSGDHRKVGILGLGRIGQAIAAKLEAFGAQISYHSRTQKDVAYPYHDTLVGMAREVDTLISVIPGGAATQHLINADVMTALGPEGVLVNVGRGSVVDEAALITALQTGKLGWAGLDVFEHEPRIPEALRTLPNVVLTPHIGSATIETRKAMGDLAIENLIQHLHTGTMKTLVPECQP